MPAMTIRNIPPETHEALHAQAKRNGRSAEAEVRLMLAAAFPAEPEVEGLGSFVMRRRAELGLQPEDFAAFEEAMEEVRATRVVREPISFE
jgi:antitoxin FitA